MDKKWFKRWRGGEEVVEINKKSFIKIKVHILKIFFFTKLEVGKFEVWQLGLPTSKAQICRLTQNLQLMGKYATPPPIPL